MDVNVAWYQEEQDGEAKRIWCNIWDTARESELSDASLLQQQQQQAVTNGNNNNSLDNKSNSENSFNNQSNNNTTTTATATTQTNNNSNNNSFPVEKTFNPARRKGGSTNDNKASTYNMNKYQAKLVGKHGGCPWRPQNFHYSRGIIG